MKLDIDKPINLIFFDNLNLLVRMYLLVSNIIEESFVGIAKLIVLVSIEKS
jgi:hypothetical protein